MHGVGIRRSSDYLLLHFPNTIRFPSNEKCETFSGHFSLSSLFVLMLISDFSLHYMRSLSELIFYFQVISLSTTHSTRIDTDGRNFFQLASLEKVLYPRPRTRHDVLLTFLRFLQDNLLLDDSNVDELKDSALIPAATDVPQEHDLWHLWDPTDEWMFRERFAICMFYALSIAVQDRIRSNHSMDYRRSTGLLESRECTNPRQGTFSTLSSEVIGMVYQAFACVVAGVANRMADYKCLWRNCSPEFLLQGIHSGRQHGASIFA